VVFDAGRTAEPFRAPHCSSHSTEGDPPLCLVANTPWLHPRDSCQCQSHLTSRPWPGLLIQPGPLISKAAGG